MFLSCLAVGEWQFIVCISLIVGLCAHEGKSTNLKGKPAEKPGRVFKYDNLVLIPVPETVQSIPWATWTEPNTRTMGEVLCESFRPVSFLLGSSQRDVTCPR